MNFYVARNEDIRVEYNADGFARTELLPGTYDGGVRNYKCFLKAGCQVEPECYADKLVLLFFGKGEGYVADASAAHAIRELSFYAPHFDKAPYRVQAFTDMEFVMAVIDMSEGD